MGVGDTHSINPTARMWLNQGTFGGGAPDTNPEITFDLGSEVTLDHMKLFNYNEIVPTAPNRDNELLGRGIRFADVLVAGEDMVFTSLGTAEFARAPGNETTDFGQILPLAGDLLTERLGLTGDHLGVDRERRPGGRPRLRPLGGEQ